ncbi:hypothetical protein EON65_11225 [archaeon]|nr:MAG: hypothetical protein EON65_11225 [archaeon]
MIFHQWPYREDLLRGILGADQIGFHLYEYARHFITVCHRTLGYSADINAQGMVCINIDGREVGITCIHVGVDMPRVNEVVESEKFVKEVREWKQKFGNRIVISGKSERLTAKQCSTHTQMCSQTQPYSYTNTYTNAYIYRIHT